MDLVEDLLESACAELEDLGHPEFVADIRAILAKIELCEKDEPVDEEDEMPAEPEE